jgi:hypothetical protein
MDVDMVAKMVILRSLASIVRVGLSAMQSSTECGLFPHQPFDERLVSRSLGCRDLARKPPKSLL